MSCVNIKFRIAASLPPVLCTPKLELAGNVYKGEYRILFFTQENIIYTGNNNVHHDPRDDGSPALVTYIKEHIEYCSLHRKL